MGKTVTPGRWRRFGIGIEGDQAGSSVGQGPAGLGHHGGLRAGAAHPAVEAAVPRDQGHVSGLGGDRALARDHGDDGERLVPAGEVGGELEQFAPHRR